MKSKIFIKSNYIKNNKDKWIYCDSKLLCHKNVTFLHFKSENFDRNSLNSDFEIRNNYECSSILQLYQSKFKNYRINVLCNLSHFKTCVIKTVNFEGFSKLAIKLIPPGLLKFKKLYMIPDDENSLTDWYSLLSRFIDKTNSSLVINTVSNNSIAMKLSSSFITFKSNSDFEEMYISLDDNDAYETNSQNEFYLVTVEPTSDSVKLNIKGNYILKLGSESLDLLDISTREIIHSFPYSSIRRFGAKENTFKLEAGRHCTTGDGNFTFCVKDAVLIADKLKSNAKKLKLNRSLINNSSTELTEKSENILQKEQKSYALINSNNFENKKSSSTNSVNQYDKKSVLRNSKSVGFLSQKNINCMSFPNKFVREEIDSKDISATFKADEVTQIASDKQNINNIEKNPDDLILSSINESTTNEVTSEKNNSLSESAKTLNIDRTTSLINTKRPFIFDVSQMSSRTKRIEEVSEPLPEDVSMNSDVCNNSNETRPKQNVPEKNISQTFSRCTPYPDLSSPTDYKVSESTFFKYRQVPKPPIRTTPLLYSNSQATTLTSFKTPFQNLGRTGSLYSPKIPPPLLPKPKFKLFPENDNQSSY